LKKKKKKKKEEEEEEERERELMRGNLCNITKNIIYFLPFPCPAYRTSVTALMQQ
jgi:hypothetical protein